jgi:hypothetical protein
MAFGRLRRGTQEKIMGVLQSERLVLCAGLALAITACGDQAPSPSDILVEQRSSKVADAFQQTLQGELQAAMMQGGPIMAASVCSEAAPAIARAQREDSGAEVRRVALRNRNPAAQVTADMRPHYDALAKAPLVNGVPATRVWKTRSADGDRVNFMRAVPMQAKPCAACHGTDVAPEVADHIRAIYPDDLATGFSPGEMRGAIVISWPASHFEAGK